MAKKQEYQIVPGYGALLGLRDFGYSFKEAIADVVDNSINVEIYVMNKGHKYWKELYDRLLSLDFDLSQMERDIFALVAKPGKLLSEKQCKIIKASEERAADQGVKIN